MKESGITWMLKRKPCMLSNNNIQKKSENRLDNTISFNLFFFCGWKLWKDKGNDIMFFFYSKDLRVNMEKGILFFLFFLLRLRECWFVRDKSKLACVFVPTNQHCLLEQQSLKCFLCFCQKLRKKPQKCFFCFFNKEKIFVFLLF